MTSAVSPWVGRGGRLLCGALLAGVAGGPSDLLVLDQVPLGPGLPAGWEVRAVKGFEGPEVEIALVDGRRVVRVAGAGRAGWIHRDLRPIGRREVDSLRWSWRVLSAPATSDLTTEATDDSPIRLYVIFGNPRAVLGGSGRIIFYSFGNAEPVGYQERSHVSGRIQVVKVDGAADRGVWREHVVDPDADYRRIWQRLPPAITGIGLMQDTDQTGERAMAEVRWLELFGSGR